MQSNLHYFEMSLQNDDEIIDFSNPEGVLVISKNAASAQTDLMKANHALIENITAYKVLRYATDSISLAAKTQILQNIIDILESTDLINYSAFCVYFQVLKYSYSSYNANKSKMSKNEKIELIKKIVEEYIDYRHNVYFSHGYSDQVLQVMSDAASSRRNGITGIQKIEKILSPNGFTHIHDLRTFSNTKTCYLLPDKGDKEVFNAILGANAIQFTFHEKREQKYPDMLIKIEKDMFIVEHKLTNGEGGSQNAEINEIIEFIAAAEKNPNVHYVSCLQGNFIKNLSRGANKSKAQNENIRKNLTRCPNNYFVNGFGLQLLIDDYIKEI